jgi:hypothetical protein
MQKGCEKKDSPIPLIGTFFFNECTLECFIYDGEKWKKITDGNLIYKLGKDLASLNGLINEKTLEIYFYNNNIIKKIEDIKIESNNTTDIVLKKESLLVLEVYVNGKEVPDIPNSIYPYGWEETKDGIHFLFPLSTFDTVSVILSMERVVRWTKIIKNEAVNKFLFFFPFEISF